MQGSGIPFVDMGAASIKLNDDGSFNLLVGAVDLGTGADTVQAQIAAEVLGVSTEDILVYSADTDLTPFDVGAYASGTTYISGMAVKKAAEQVRDRIAARAASHARARRPRLRSSCATAAPSAPDGRYVTLQEVALNALHVTDQEQIMAVASHRAVESPSPFAAQAAVVEVDVETGEVTVDKLVTAVDCGVAINPITASGQVEGAMVMALGYALCEEVVLDGDGTSGERQARPVLDLPSRRHASHGGVPRRRRWSRRGRSARRRSARSRPTASRLPFATRSSTRPESRSTRSR